MKRDLTIIDDSGRRVLITWNLSSWAVICIDAPDDYRCRTTISGYFRRPSAIAGAEAHLRWHANGKPECVDCGAWLNRRGAKRCRKGTCGVAR